METFFKEIVKTLGLGTLTSQVKSVFGGYMHKMFCMETTTGKYAVKLLNPMIMKREDVFENYEIAERLEKKLLENNIPIVPALEFNETKMQCTHNQFFYVFDWVDGKALLSEEIRKEHCELIGEVLASIHKIEQTNEPFSRNEINIDWDFYIRLANQKCPEISALLNDNRDLLYLSQKQGNAALHKIPAVKCICNGDMDSKNVLWVNGKPKVIDLECLNYGNPYMEMFQLALCWSGYEHCDINYDLLTAFINSYRNSYGYFEVDWNVLYSTNFGRLEWLEYNVKRALMLECENEEERLLGIEQVKETIGHVFYYAEIRGDLLNHLNKIVF